MAFKTLSMNTQVLTRPSVTLAALPSPVSPLLTSLHPLVCFSTQAMTGRIFIRTFDFGVLFAFLYKSFSSFSSFFSSVLPFQCYPTWSTEFKSQISRTVLSFPLIMLSFLLWHLSTYQHRMWFACLLLYILFCIFCLLSLRF